MTNFSSRERKVTTMVSVSSGSQVGEEEQDLANQHCGHVTGCRVLIGRSGPEAGHLPAAAADGHGEVVEGDLLASDHVVLVTCTMTRNALTI